MEIAVLLFDRITALDAIGPYEVLSRIPGATVKFVAEQAGPVRTDRRSLGLVADFTIDEVPSPQILLIPGGPGQMALMENKMLLDWVGKAHETTRWTTSVCTGSLVLGAAGLLRGLKATSHWLAYDALRTLGAEPVPQRVVQSGKIITAAGVSAGIDMALRLVAIECGDEIAQMIQLGIEYDPQPPFDAGSPDKAPAAVVQKLRESSRFLNKK